MIKSISTICLMIISSAVFSQGGVGISNSGTAPNANSMLDVSSDSKGVLITRLSTTERTTLGNGIGLAENGMLVYDKDLLAFYYWDGTQWVQVGNGTGSDDQNLTGATLTGTSLQIDIENGTSATVDLGTLQDGVDDADNDPNNEIELPATATTGQVLSWDGTAWVAQNSASGADNWGNDVVNTSGTNITGDGTTTNPLTMTEVDGDITNEIQDLSLNTTTNILTITNNGTPTNIDLTPYLDNTDAQTLNLVGNTLTISNGNNVTLTDNVNDADSSPTNEIELPTGGTNGQILSTDGSGNYTWITDNAGTDNQNITGSSFNASTGNLVIGIENGTNQTINFNGLKDHDWYEVGGTTAPDNINDNIFTQGNVGIKNTTPSSSLSIGNALFFDKGTGNVSIASDIFMAAQGLIASESNMFFNTDSDGNSSGDFYFGKGTEDNTATRLMTILNNGRVGIGTSTPSSQTHILSTATMPAFPIGATAPGHVFRIQQGGGASLFMDGNAMVSDAPTNLSIGTLLNAPIALGTNDQTRMTITGTGDVGIGLGVPLAKFHVVGGDAYFTDQPINNFSTSRSAQAVVTDNFRAASDNGIRLYDGNSNSHLHIGSRDFTYFQAYSTASIPSGTLGTSSIDFDDNSNFAFLSINPLGGRVGVSTIAPTEIFHVNGNIKVGLLNSSGTVQPAGPGDAIIFSGAPDVSATFDGENSDVITLKRYNVASDESELRLTLGDNAQVQDAFSIGYANFTEIFRFETAGAAKKPGGGAWAATSDKRTKKDIVNFSDGLNVLTKINPVTFKYNGHYNTTENGIDYVGIIAQDVQKVAPYMIGSYEAPKTPDSETKEEVLNYDGGTYMLYVLVNSVKEQQLQIEELKKNNELLIQQIKELKK